MEKAIRLSEYEESILHTGLRLRIAQSNGYENIVDYMICDIPGIKGSCLITCTGYKSGCLRQALPDSSLPTGWAAGIDYEWYLSNWNDWGWGAEVPIESVLVLGPSTIP